MGVESDWYYHDGQQRQGPVTAEQLLVALLSAPDPGRVLVWRAGLAEWVEAGSVPDISEQLPPPLPPPVAFQDPRNRPVPIEEAEGIARLYRRLVLLVGLQILLSFVQIPVSLIPMGLIPEAQRPLLEGAVLAVLIGVLVVIAITAYQLTLLLDAGWPPLWAIAMFLPCINILGLLAISAKAQDWCHRYGIKVGFLGPTRESIEALRRRNLIRILFLACASFACVACGSAPAERPAQSAAGRVDHHVHILSPELVRDWKSLGVPFSRPDPAYTSVDVILEPDRGTHAFLVSMAHIYGSGEFRSALGLSTEEEHARVRLANDHVAREVARAPERLVGFCAVNPLRPYAGEEMERCRVELGLAGLKLHVPNAELQLSDDQHLAVLAAVARRADQERRPLLVHLAPVEGELAEADLQRFLEQVVRPHPELELYLAHLGGNGGYRISARRVVRAFTDFFRESEENARRPIYFELSGGLLAETTDGVPASTEEDARQLAEDLRALGLERVLFGSDYPVFAPEAFERFLRERLPLSANELEAVLTNRAPALARAAEIRCMPGARMTAPHHVSPDSDSVFCGSSAGAPARPTGFTVEKRPPRRPSRGMRSIWARRVVGRWQVDPSC